VAAEVASHADQVAAAQRERGRRLAGGREGQHVVADDLRPRGRHREFRLGFPALPAPRMMCRQVGLGVGNTAAVHHRVGVAQLEYVAAFDHSQAAPTGAFTQRFRSVDAHSPSTVAATFSARAALSRSSHSMPSRRPSTLRARPRMNASASSRLVQSNATAAAIALASGQDSPASAPSA